MSDFCAIANSHRTAELFPTLLSLQQTFLQIIQNSNFNRHPPPFPQKPPGNPPAATAQRTGTRNGPYSTESCDARRDTYQRNLRPAAPAPTELLRTKRLFWPEIPPFCPGTAPPVFPRPAARRTDPTRLPHSTGSCVRARCNFPQCPFPTTTTTNRAARSGTTCLTLAFKCIISQTFAPTPSSCSLASRAKPISPQEVARHGTQLSTKFQPLTSYTHRATPFFYSPHPL